MRIYLRESNRFLRNETHLSVKERLGFLTGYPSDSILDPLNFLGARKIYNKRNSLLSNIQSKIFLAEKKNK